MDRTNRLSLERVKIEHIVALDARQRLARAYDLILKAAEQAEEQGSIQASAPAQDGGQKGNCNA